MYTGRIILLLGIGAPVLALAAAYAGLVYDGTLPAPNWPGIFQAFSTNTVSLAQVFLVVGLGIVGLLAVLAPIIFAVRASDAVTVLISLAMTGGAIAMLVMSRTVMDQISALIIFLANITLSGIVYAAHRIAPAK